MKYCAVSAMDTCNGDGYYEDLLSYDEAVKLAIRLFNDIDDNGEKRWTGIVVYGYFGEIAYRP